MQQLTVGNDIVDLTVDEPALHKGYITRVCTANEISKIGNDKAKLWLHWAAKEAAFKALRRLSASIAFIPRDFEFDQGASVVCWKTIALPCRVAVSDNYVHVTCALDEIALEKSRVWIAKIELGSKSSASDEVRALLRRELSGLLSNPGSALLVSDRAGIPLIQWQSREFPVSLSHHGRFVAAAVSINQDLSEVPDSWISREQKILNFADRELRLAAPGSK